MSTVYEKGILPIPTFPLSNTTIEAEAFAFSTSKAVVADVVPIPTL
jgi:hypothetical protein